MGYKTVCLLLGIMCVNFLHNMGTNANPCNGMCMPERDCMIMHEFGNDGAGRKEKLEPFCEPPCQDGFQCCCKE